MDQAYSNQGDLMKLLSTVASIATLVSVNAFAGDHTINIVGRTSLVYKDNDVKKTQVPSSSSFNIDFLRTMFAGSISPTVKYYVSADLLSANGSSDSVDGTSAFVDEAFATKAFGQGTSLTLGKKAVLIGGREYDYYNYDRYTSSAFFAATPANQVGLTLAHEIAGQTFMAQYFNGNKDNGKTGVVDGTTQPINAQSKFGYAIAWNGNIANGLIKPIIAYTVVPEAAGSRSTEGRTSRVNRGDDQFLGAGLQFNIPLGLVIEADYDLLTEKNATGTIASAHDLKTTSIVGLVRYAGERFAPFVKFISDTSKNNSVKFASKMAYDIGVEFKESKDDLLRYNLVYSGASVKTGINTTEVKSSPKAILVGVKFDAAILK